MGTHTHQEPRAHRRSAGSVRTERQWSSHLSSCSTKVTSSYCSPPEICPDAASGNPGQNNACKQVKLCPLHWYKASTQVRLPGCTGEGEGVPPAHPPKPPDLWSCFRAALPRGMPREPPAQTPSGCRCYITAFTRPLKRGSVWGLCLDKTVSTRHFQHLSPATLWLLSLLFYKRGDGAEGALTLEAAPLSGLAHCTRHTEAMTHTLRVAFRLGSLVSSCRGVTPGTAGSKCRGPTLP